MTITMFSTKVTLVWNTIFAIASFSPLVQTPNMSSELVTRFFFTQFWKEFSREALIIFYQEDYKHQKALKNKSGVMKYALDEPEFKRRGQNENK